MSRRLRFVIFALVASLALGTSACASTTGPDYGDCTGGVGSGTCP